MIVLLVLLVSATVWYLLQPPADFYVESADGQVLVHKGYVSGVEIFVYKGSPPENVENCWRAEWYNVKVGACCPKGTHIVWSGGNEQNSGYSCYREE